jgi:proline iminopeptidase
MKKLFFILSFLLISIHSIGQAQNFITSDGVSLFFKVKGKGTPCLYIHGGPGSGSYWMEKFSGDILEERFQMIYLDLRGVGRSGSPADGNYNMERMIKDFEEIRRHLGFDTWVIMGHSFSGTMLTGYAAMHPRSLKGMMMFNCSLNLAESIHESWIPKACEFLGLKDDAYFKNDSISFHDKLNRLFPLLNEKDVMWELAFSHKDNERKMNETFNEIPNWNGDFSGVGMSHNDYLVDFKKHTSAIKTPVLFFYGTSDWSIGPKHYKGVKFPNMLLWKSNVGHIPFMENKEDLKKAIDYFKKKNNL